MPFPFPALPYGLLCRLRALSNHQEVYHLQIATGNKYSTALRPIQPVVESRRKQEKFFLMTEKGEPTLTLNQRYGTNDHSPLEKYKNNPVVFNAYHIHLINLPDNLFDFEKLQNFYI
uniref:Uncharacterized protein n=1 Tax=Panagrellus redivivus TaxID=6233 RepID=A0A7E4VJY9_PANRE